MVSLFSRSKTGGKKDEGGKKDLFGVSLETCFVRKPSPDGKLPFVVHSLIEYLNDQDAVNCEGILRLCGNHMEVQTVRQKYNSGNSFVLGDVVKEMHTASRLLKLWLDQLKEPLLTFELYDELSAFQKNDPQAIEKMRSIVSKLPDLNYRTARYVFTFLHSISVNAAVNKMHAGNIALLMTPVLVRSPSVDPNDLMSFANVGSGSGAVDALVKHAPEIFDAASLDSSVNDGDNSSTSAGLLSASDTADQPLPQDVPSELVEPATPELRDNHLRKLSEELPMPAYGDGAESHGTSASSDYETSDTESETTTTMTDDASEPAVLSPIPSFDRSPGIAPLNLIPAHSHSSDTLMQLTTRSRSRVVGYVETTVERFMNTDSLLIDVAETSTAINTARSEPSPDSRTESPFSRSLDDAIERERRLLTAPESREHAAVEAATSLNTRALPHRLSRTKLGPARRLSDTLQYQLKAWDTRFAVRKGMTPGTQRGDRAEIEHVVQAYVAVDEFMKTWATLTLQSQWRGRKARKNRKTTPAATPSRTPSRPVGPVVARDLLTSPLPSYPPLAETQRPADPITDPLGYASMHLVRARDGSSLPAMLEDMTEPQLKMEKSLIKLELRDYDRRYTLRTGQEPTRADKEPIRPLYQRYKAVNALLELFDKSAAPAANLDEMTLPSLMALKRQLQHELHVIDVKFKQDHVDYKSMPEGAAKRQLYVNLKGSQNRFFESHARYKAVKEEIVRRNVG
ncbi:rho GTPase-activating protein [Carpediemonas membranifera]|uniref:Rho GTPase-activating protein n=1 Tax=Carpediemonas membranifera TaxID=201153 RepID=A0A8J6AV00_9EUKA|nr:rho GTPase-activating protein [Carpediemonas membranifera]|eukprot:KAG9392250.1 rho GTPase-activating protein [Carpediemonas membranifera]